MNNIEFRVWCKNKKEWEKDECFLSQEGNLLCQVDRNIVIPLKEDNYVVQLFTGNKDKNNTKIFEGDYFKSYKNKLYEVIFWSCGFWLAPVLEVYANYELDLVHSQNVLGIVIGNIFENDIKTLVRKYNIGKR